MDQSFYIGAVGAHQQMRRLNVHSNNIANVNTVAFKADRSRFANLVFQQDDRTADAPVSYGVGASMLMTSTDFSQGGVVETGRFLDYMIDGDGFFAIADLETGEISFTRRGSFVMSELLRDSGEVDEEGQAIPEKIYYLSDNLGRFVLSNAGNMIEMTDWNGLDALPIGIFDYRNYNGMTLLDETRYMPVEKNGNLWAGTGTLLQGRLEQSNTDLAEELTKVIESQRAYGLALKVMQTSDEIETTINNLRS